VDVHSRPLGMQEVNGFTLIEAMVSIALLTIFLMGVVAVQAYFGTQTNDREMRTCLLDQASNALLQSRNGITAPTSLVCKGQTGTITMTTAMLAEPNPNSCMTVTAAASAGGKSAKVTSCVCSF
jgi:prepilin-type N-terminal cleavage/methylation domain-containing protein